MTSPSFTHYQDGISITHLDFVDHGSPTPSLDKYPSCWTSEDPHGIQARSKHFANGSGVAGVGQPVSSGCRSKTHAPSPALAAHSARSVLDQGEFKNRRKYHSRRGKEAEVFFAQKSAFLRRRLPFFTTLWLLDEPDVIALNPPQRVR